MNTLVEQDTASHAANTILAIPAFTDNYIWCIHNDAFAIVVDPGDAAPVLAYLKEHQLMLVGVLITHHHFDHTDGIPALTSVYPNALIYGPKSHKIKGLTHELAENDSIRIGELDLEFKVLNTPGHTLDHIVYYNDDTLFCGDTLFSGGCGRMFEGTPEVFYASLLKLSQLPDTTQVFCTHEYTQANLAFATSIEPTNKALQEYTEWVNTKRLSHEITLPSNIAQENAINPFLRCHIPAMQAMLLNDSIEGTNNAVNCFAALRKLKDNF